MAPKRERSKATETEHASKRVTRSSTRLNGALSEPVVAKPSPMKKKVSFKNEVRIKGKKAPTKKTETKVVEAVVVSAASKVADGLKSKTIIIEHCKQCNSFKTRALQVKDGLEKAVPGVTVIVNQEKPRRGCFEIREEDGTTFISLLDMKRPFSRMKELDMNDVVAEIIEKIK